MKRNASTNPRHHWILALLLFVVASIVGPIDAAAAPKGVPAVMLSAGHAARCLVGVGDAMPTPSLPDLDGKTQSPPELAGKKGTVVVYWQDENPMVQTLIADLRSDVQEPYGKAGISVIGVAVGLDAAAAQRQLVEADAEFPVLLDRDGAAFARIGKEMLPRIYVLDAEGKIVWFDIEYSRATRRELAQTLRAMTR